MALTDSLAGLGASCVDIARARIELIGLDLEDAVWRVATLFCVSLFATLLIFCASIFGASAFVAAYWSTHPVWALLVVCASYMVVGVAMLIALARWFNSAPFLMRESLDALRRDEQLLGAHS